jgi:hypothetical protein
MPICESCGVAYLDGEEHRCEPKAHPLGVLGVAIGGLVIGGVLGAMTLTVVFCLGFGANQCGVGGIFTGLPLGALVGAIVGVRSLHRGTPSD